MRTRDIALEIVDIWQYQGYAREGCFHLYTWPCTYYVCVAYVLRTHTTTRNQFGLKINKLEWIFRSHQVLALHSMRNSSKLNGRI